MEILILQGQTLQSGRTGVSLIQHSHGDGKYHVCTIPLTRKFEFLKLIRTQWSNGKVRQNVMG